MGALSGLPPDPESVSNGQLFMLLTDLRQQIVRQEEKAAVEQAKHLKRIEDLTGEVAMARKETAELVDLWRTGRTVVLMIKLLGGIAGAALAMWGLYALARGIPHHPVRPG